MDCRGCAAIIFTKFCCSTICDRLWEKGPLRVTVADPEILEWGFQVEVIAREACEIFGSHPLLHCHAHFLCKES